MSENESGKRARQDESFENGAKKPKDAQSILKELLEEKTKLAPFLTMLPHCAQLLTREIEALQNNEPTGAYFAPLVGGDQNTLESTVISQQELGNGVIKISIRIPAPTEKYPGFNFVGRLLGPRGNTLKELQRDSGCKMLIRGKGSVKLKHGETDEELSKNPAHAHLAEPLHIIVDYEGPASSKDQALNRAKSMLKILLHPPASEEDDVVKKQQLRELALMNGTFKEHPSERATRMHAGGRGAAAHSAHDWPSTSSSAYADPAVVAYNRGYAMQQAAMSGASGGWGQSPYSAYEQQYTAGYPAYPPSGSY